MFSCSLAFSCTLILTPFMFVEMGGGGGGCVWGGGVAFYIEGIGGFWERREGGADWRQCWMKHKWQLLVPLSADILWSSTWKSTFYFEKSLIKKKSVLIFFLFFGRSLHVFQKRAPHSFCVFVFKFPLVLSHLLDSSFFTRSRPVPRRRQTPGPLHQYPWGQCPQWANVRSSATCIPSLSCPIYLCVPVQEIKMTRHFSETSEKILFLLCAFIFDHWLRSSPCSCLPWRCK